MSQERPPSRAVGRTLGIENPEKRKKILEKIVPLIERGLTIIKACEASGVPQATYYRWKSQGKAVGQRLDADDLLEPDESYSLAEVAVWQFWQALNKAELDCMERNLLAIQVASQQHWQAAAWWLERRFPKEYGRNYNVTHSGNEDAPVAVKDVTGKPTREELLRKLSPEQFRTVVEARRLLREAAGAVVGGECPNTKGPQQSDAEND